MANDGAGRLEREYLEDCRSRLSHHTVKSRETSLRLFRQFLGGDLIVEATKLDVRKFLNDLKERDRARSTITKRLSDIGSFFNYVEEYRGIKGPDLSGISPKEYPKSKYEEAGCVALERREIRKLLEAASTLRNVLIVAFLYYCGLRAKEVATLKVEDVDTDNRILEVVGKGNKPRKVPYPPILDRPVQRWLNRERKSYVSSGRTPYFFPSKHGDHLQSKTLHKIINGLAEEAEIQKKIGKRANGDRILRVNNHACRRSHATHTVRDGVPPGDVQRVMGHAKRDTLLTHYIKDSDEEIFAPYHETFEGL